MFFLGIYNNNIFSNTVIFFKWKHIERKREKERVKYLINSNGNTNLLTNMILKEREDMKDS